MLLKLKKFIYFKIIFLIMALCNIHAFAQPTKEMQEEIEQYLREDSCQEIACHSIAMIEINDIKNNEKEKNANSFELLFKGYARKDSILELPLNAEEINIQKMLLNKKEDFKSLKNKNKIYVKISKGNFELKMNMEMNQNHFSIHQMNVHLKSNQLEMMRNGDVVDVSIKKDNNVEIKNTSQFQGIEAKPLIEIKKSLNAYQKWSLRTTVKWFDKNAMTSHLGQEQWIAIPILEGEKPVFEYEIARDAHFIYIPITLLNRGEFSFESIMNPLNYIQFQQINMPDFFNKKSVMQNSILNIDLNYLQSWIIKQEGKNPYMIDNNSTKWSLKPKEKLTLFFNTPQQAKGEKTSLSNLNVSWSENRLTYQLDANSTVGGRIFFELPGGTTLNQIMLNGQNVNVDHLIKMKKKRIPVDLSIGKNAILVEIQNQDNSIFFKKYPVIKFEQDVYNVRYTNTNKKDLIVEEYGADLNQEYIFLSTFICAFIVAILTAHFIKIHERKMINSISWMIISLGFINLSIYSVLLLPFLMLSLQYKTWLQEKYLKTVKAYNAYQLLMIVLAIITILITLTNFKIGLINFPNQHLILETQNITYQQIFKEGVGFFVIPYYIYKGLMLLWCITMAYFMVDIFKQVLKKILQDDLWKK